MFRALSVPGYGRLLFSGWLWQMARWVTGFTGAFIAEDLSGSARLVQLSGVALWAPLLIGGAVGGVISDRFDRRRTINGQFIATVPAAVLIGVAALTNRLSLWMIYPFMVMIGIGWVIDMTSRRSILYDLVGADHIDNAMALEAIGSSSALAIGSLIGGTIIQAMSVGAALLLVAGMLGASGIIFLSVPRVPEAKSGASTGLADLVAGVRMLRTERGLISVLVSTAIVNFFFFTFTPLMQIVGTDLGVGPALKGLLGGMLGFGMMTGSLIVARIRPHRGRAYSVGALGAMALLTGFAGIPWYAGAAAFLFISAIGVGLFGSTQGVLVMEAVDAERRGRALGLLSTAIGVLPIGMIALGEVAEVTSASTAIIGSTLIGFFSFLVSLWRRPEILSMSGSEASASLDTDA